MKAIELTYLPLLVMFAVFIDTAGEPCFTAHNLPVVNICTEETKIDDASSSVIIKADLRQNCTCELSVLNQDKAVTINIQKYDQKTSSSPSTYGCGLLLTFGIENNIIWEAQCIIDDYIMSAELKLNDVMTISSLTVSGTLKQTEGYCIEIKQGNQDLARNRLMLTCGIRSIASYSTTAGISKTRRSSTDLTNPLPFMTGRTTEKQLTTSFDPDEFIFATVAGTSVPHNTQRSNQQQKGVDDTAFYVSIAATIVGVAIVIIVTIMVLYYRRFQILTQCKKSTCSGSNTIYDTLSLPSPANSTDNASISNNYSSLNINDFQSSNDNGRLEGSQNISLSTIRTVQGYHPEVTENGIQYENTNQRRTEYANHCF